MNEQTLRVFRTLGNKYYFGEIGFFGLIKRCATAMAKNFVETISLERNSFDKLLESYPESLSYSNYLIQSCQIDYSCLNVKCWICS
jgi:hypothetical protein